MMSCDRGLLKHSPEGRLHLGEPGPGTRYRCCRAGLAGCGSAAQGTPRLTEVLPTGVLPMALVPFNSNELITTKHVPART